MFTSFFSLRSLFAILLRFSFPTVYSPQSPASILVSILRFSPVTLRFSVDSRPILAGFSLGSLSILVSILPCHFRFSILDSRRISNLESRESRIEIRDSTTIDIPFHTPRSSTIDMSRIGDCRDSRFDSRRQSHTHSTPLDPPHSTHTENAII